MSSARQKALLQMTCGGMEIAWRYAWVFFLTLALLNRPLGLAESLAVFIAAAVVTTLTGRRYQQTYQSLGLHFCGFTMVWLTAVYRMYYHQQPFFDSSWVVDWYLQHQHPQQWFIDLLISACLLLLWLGARVMMKKPSTYYAVCLRFDKGLSGLFLLLLIKFIVQAKGGLHLEEPVTVHLLIAFLTFALTATVCPGIKASGRNHFAPVTKVLASSWAWPLLC